MLDWYSRSHFGVKIPDPIESIDDRLYELKMQADEEKIERLNDKNKSLPTCPLYHSRSDLKAKPGYYPNLNDTHVAAVKKILCQVKEENLNFRNDEEHETLKALRFLRASKFDVDKTLALIRGDVQWRAEGNRSELRYQTAYEVLKCDLSIVYQYFPTWIQGVDKQSRPVSWRQCGTFDVSKVLKQTTMEQLINFHAWESEQLLRLMYTKSKMTGVNIETFMIVLDANGWILSLANSDAYTFMKALIKFDSDHYPERLGHLIIINAPSVLSMAWRVISQFLDDVTKMKIRIYGQNKLEWMPALLQLIDESQIPEQFGGKMPDLPQELILTTMEPPPHLKGSGMGDDETIIPKQVICGMPVKKGKKGGVPKKKGKKKAKKDDAEDFDALPNAMCTVSSSPLCGISSKDNNGGAGAGAAAAAGVGSGAQPSSSGKKAGWMRVLTCNAPQCNGGEDEFDFQVDVASQSGDHGHGKGSARAASQDSLDNDFYDEDADSRLPTPPPKKSTNRKAPGRPESADFKYSDVYGSPDHIPPSTETPLWNTPGPMGDASGGEYHRQGGVSSVSTPPPSLSTGFISPIGTDAKPRTVPMFSNMTSKQNGTNLPPKAKSSGVCSGCACVVM